VQDRRWWCSTTRPCALRAEQAQAGVKAAQDEQAAATDRRKLAASTLDRYRQLEAEKSVSPQEMDEVAQRAAAASARLEAVRSQTDAARSQESGAHTMLGYSRLLAPFAGVVTARWSIRERWPRRVCLCYRWTRPERCNSKLRWMSRRLVRFTRGLKAQVAIDGSSSADLAGTVAEIDPAADPASHSFLVKIDLPPSSQLRAGMYGTAELPTASARRLSFRAPLLSCAALWPVRTFSTGRELRSSVPSRWARPRATS